MQTVKLIKDSPGHYCLIDGISDFDWFDRELQILVKQFFDKRYTNIRSVGVYIFFRHLAKKSCGRKEPSWNFVFDYIQMMIYEFKEFLLAI